MTNDTNQVRRKQYGQLLNKYKHSLPWNQVETVLLVVTDLAETPPVNDLQHVLFLVRSFDCPL